jgi:AcrR family transcriptional regulator
MPRPEEHMQQPVTTRQQLTQRQGATVDALVSAGLDVLRDVGYDLLTLRSVAVRAGVTHTTAYAYFSSKEHLVAEIFWRRLRSVPAIEPIRGAPLAERITAALEMPVLHLTDDPALAQSGLAALLSTDPEVDRLRTEVGADLVARIATALGDDADPAVVETVLLVFSGAMLQAGMGYFDYTGVVRRIASVAALLDAG